MSIQEQILTRLIAKDLKRGDCLDGPNGIPS